jgi:hypothetical protein
MTFPQLGDLPETLELRDMRFVNLAATNGGAVDVVIAASNSVPAQSVSVHDSVFTGNTATGEFGHGAR